jgi:two-component system, NarL family, sensor histidine kinase UhpB
MQIQRPRLTRRDDSLIGQVVAANVVLVALTILAASLAAGLDLSISQQRWQFLVLALAIVLTLCVNMWMLQRRFAPLEHLIERVEGVDPSHPASFRLETDNFDEVDRLALSFRRLLDRIESERRRGGRLVVRAQEEERRRLARDLHDEVNQALTAILLRLEALAQDAPPERAREVAELKRLVNQTMGELAGLARQLRPTALDDHGLVPAIEAQLKRFAARTGVQARLDSRGDTSLLDEDEQTAIYRIAQEALANIGRHAGASSVEIELTAGEGGTELRVRDDGRGFDPLVRAGSTGLGLEGMAERARLVGGELDVRSAPDGGTSVTLRLS